MKKYVALLTFMVGSSAFAGASSNPPAVTNTPANAPACFVELKTERELILINAYQVQKISATADVMTISLIGGKFESIVYPSKEAAVAAARRFAQNFQRCKPD